MKKRPEKPNNVANDKTCHVAKTNVMLQNDLIQQNPSIIICS